MKTAVISIAIILIVFISLYFIIGNYFYNFALKRRKEKKFLKENQHLTQSEAVMEDEEKWNQEADEKFQLEHAPKQVQIISVDGLTLKSHFFINDQAHHKWAIVVHGYSANSKWMIRYARKFHEQGYHVFAPDLRGHGESEGDYIGMGWHDRKDLLLWIEEILARDPEAEIVLFGLSMGAATVMMASGENLPDNVKVIVEDCGYTSVYDVFTYQLKDLFNLPPFPAMNAANTITKWRAGFDIKEASALEQVRKSKTPILFIHGEKDSFVPYPMVHELYNAATVEKQRLIIPEAGHAEAEKVDPTLYWNTVWSFVGQYIEDAVEERELVRT